MTKIYNKLSAKEKRRNLRQHMTPEEVILWNHIKDEKLGYKFRRQYSIGEYIADFYCAKKKLVVELDGSQHLDNKEYDDIRAEYMNSLGIITIRFWNADIKNNLNGVVMRIQELLERS